MTVSLYDRLGGYDAIGLFATQLVDRAKADALLGRFWAHSGDDRDARALQLLIDYLVRDMALAHVGMGIDEADWARFIELVIQVAGELGVVASEGGEVLAFLDDLKASIVITRG